MSSPEIPAQYRPIGPYVKIAQDFKVHDKVLYYWLLNFAVEKALAIGNPNDAEAKEFIIGMLNILEKMKEENAKDESYMVGPVAQCHVEAKALRLFSTADEQDRQGIFNKNVVKAFYTSGLLFDILTLFTKEELEDKLKEARKYAKWKATDIHNCLKAGRTPQSGPSTNEDDLTRDLLSLNVNKPQPTPRTTSGVSSTNQPFNQSNPANFSPVNPPNQFGFDKPPSAENFGWSQHPQQFNTGYGHPPQPQQPYAGEQNFQQPGFPPHPQPQHHHVAPSQPAPVQPNAVSLEDFIEARKLTKMATSALDYEDAKTAIDFLRKALKTLEK